MLSRLFRGVPSYVRRVVNPYNEKDSALRKGVMVCGPWEDSITEYINKKQIRALYLNQAFGWEDTDYRFLSDLGSIEELDIIALKTDDISAIGSMRNLKDLGINCAAGGIVDFSNLKQLQRCYLVWWPGAGSIFDVESLEDLYIDKVKLADYSVFSRLKNLRKLTIGHSPIDSVGWMPELKRLEDFRMHYCKKCTDFSVIGSCHQLKRLSISNNNLTNLEFVNGLHALEFLDISDNGKIDSLKPLENLKSLKAIAFAGSKTTIVDGDLSVLERLPKLSMLMFGPRKHYTHKLIKKWNWENFDKPAKLLEKK